MARDAGADRLQKALDVVGKAGYVSQVTWLESWASSGSVERVDMEERTIEIADKMVAKAAGGNKLAARLARDGYGTWEATR